MAIKLLEEAKAGKGKFYIQFGGQGAPWYKELKQYYDKPEMKPFFDAAIKGIEEEIDKVKGTIGLPKGLDIRSWLDDDSTLPDDIYLSYAAVSLGMIQFTQFAHFENLRLKGYDLSEMLKVSAGATGHSQGVISATFVSLGLEGEEYYKGITLFVKYMFLMGVRAQEAFPYLYAEENEITKTEELGGKDPQPMVAILGETHEFIQKYIDEVNPSLDKEKQLYMSLYNSPSNRIVSSHRSSLVQLHEKLKPLIDEKKIKFVYLRTSAPFHCQLMEPISEPFEKDIIEMGFNYTGSDLKIPVTSFANGENLQNEKNLGRRLYRDLMIENLHWDIAMKPVADDSSITLVIDYGPGKTSQRLSKDTLAGLNCSTPILSAAVPKDLKVLLAE